ncbi:class I SAM-dependent methyltransferase [Agaribacterium sp. ZY112]|uniref:class I SAM-dependent methyltransferase n=1 Tax=Agaribacterium sp. ZY112 TaxID=3233574 RepID=UPI003526A50C
MSENAVFLYSQNPEQQLELEQLALKLELNVLNEEPSDQTVLELNETELSLTWLEGKKRLNLMLDFVGGAAAHRRLYGGGKSQAIAKACGISAAYKPSILDATAGQGGDAFVLASLGAQVLMLERTAVAYALLENALERAAAAGDEELAPVIERMSLLRESALDYLPKAEAVDIVYLDPMFPERKKSAQVKKNMRVFHSVIGADSDADDLLVPALAVARYRVVVKRPKGAPFLADTKPTYQLDGKSTRYDIYVNKALPSNK